MTEEIRSMDDYYRICYPKKWARRQAMTPLERAKEDYLEARDYYLRLLNEEEEKRRERAIP
jgi:hypothetical protein